MVQVLTDPTLSPSGTPTYEKADGPLVRRLNLGRSDSMTREEHAQRMRELNMKRGMMRTPRRGWSLTDYQADHDYTQPFQSISSQVDRHAPIPEDSTPPHSPVAETPEEPTKQETVQLIQRPKLPPPRRSYSVMDYEPFPAGQPVPPKDFTILDLPSELHYAIFDFLDPIDSVCLGLANSNLYEIHRRMHGTVPLSSRYSGPNDMEWAWRGAGPLVHRIQAEKAKQNAIEQMRVKGQVYCRKCGISRCELHRHLKDWMGDGYEYCSIKDVYGKPAGEDAKPYCYMKSPKNPHRCGRHGGRKTAQ
ncbi:Fc.00g100810.m01.CDS01 [Cosmosporella sp. VM-42]